MTATDLLVHIGDYKTGSTSIQECLRDGGYRLRHGATLFYPGRAPHHGAIADQLRARAGPVEEQPLLARTARAITARSADHAVLSAEHFMAIPPDRLSTWLQHDLPDLAPRARVLAYARPHASFALSMYAEHTKLGFTGLPIDSYVRWVLQTRRMSYTPKFRRWQNTFGDRFSLRPMRRETLEGGDVVVDFFVRLTGEPGTEVTAAAPANRSLDISDLNFVRRVQASLARLDPLADATKRRRLGNWLHAELSGDADPDGPRPRLTAAAFGAILDACRPDAAALDRTFFHDSDLGDRPMTEGLEAEAALIDDGIATADPALTDRHMAIATRMPVPERDEILSGLERATAG